jgi:ankyrin repeat protein
MTKENTLFKTQEIKTQIIEHLHTPLELLWFHIKDNNFIKFKTEIDKHKVNVDSIDNEQNSLLNLAVQCNAYEISEYLLWIGADVNLQNILLNAPLHYALYAKNFKLANLLINKKADEELVNSKGLTPWQCIGNTS